MKDRRSKRHEQFRKVIEKLRRGGWFYPKVLERELKIPNRTIKHDLKLGLYLGIFKQENERGPYAWIDYESEEEIVRKVIGEHFPYGVDVSLQAKYQPTTDSMEELIRKAGIEAGRDPKEPEFRAFVYKILKKCRNEKVP